MMRRVVEPRAPVSAHAHSLARLRARSRAASRRERRGFTLIEMGVCLVIMAICAAVVAPAFARLGTDQPQSGADKYVLLLKQARNFAIERNYTVTVRIDPVTNRFRVDTVGTNGLGVLADSTLDLGASESLETTLDRLQYTFRPTGSVIADTVIVRGIGTSSLVSVDPWTGEAKLVAR
ncbi:MAG: prepilin-type N-terminal cleavage/methylation domain-containing protein [Gemmatimonadaceae bacterium]